MTTESEARDLLARAAATIEVTPGELLDLPVRRRLRWFVPVAAAAAVALIIGGGVLLGQRDEPEPVNPSKRLPVEKEHVYAPDQVPSLLGYTTEEARRLLKGGGYRVKLRELETTCEPGGLVLATEPVAGSRVPPEATVTLQVSKPQRVHDCVGSGNRTIAWDLFRFARGLGAPPMLDSSLDLYGPDGQHRRLTAAEAKDPENWVLCGSGECHSALATLAEQATQTYRVNGEPRAAHLSIGHFGADMCPGAKVRTPASEYLSVEVPQNGPIGTRCYDTQVLFKVSRGLSEVRLVLPDPPPPSGPDRHTPTPEQQEAADAFAAWAKGTGSAPRFAPDVRQLVQDRLVDTIGRERASVRAAWRLCSGVGEGCRVDPLAVIAADWHDPVATRRGEGRGGFCHEPAADLQKSLVKRLKDIVELGQPEPRDCGDAYAIELWVDDSGVIDAVNLTVIPQVGPLPRPR